MRHKMDLQGWKKTHWVGCGDLNDWIILTIWFQTVIHSAGQLLKLNFLLEMIDGYSLLQWYPSPTQATERAEWFSWSLTGGQVSQIAFSLILVCVLVHLPVLIPHLPWGLGISQQLQISYEPVRQTDILGANIVTPRMQKDLTSLTFGTEWRKDWFTFSSDLCKIWPPIVFHFFLMS